MNSETVSFTILCALEEQKQALNLARTWVDSQDEFLLWTGDDFLFLDKTLEFKQGLVPHETYVLLSQHIPAAYIELHRFQFKNNSSTISDYWVFGRLLCNPVLRRQGFAKQLIKFCFDRAFALGAPALFAHREINNYVAQRLYECFGFITLGQQSQLRNAFHIKLDPLIYPHFKQIDNQHSERWRSARLSLRSNTTLPAQQTITQETTQLKNGYMEVQLTVNTFTLGRFVFIQKESQPDRVTLVSWEIQPHLLSCTLKKWIRTMCNNGKTVMCFSSFADIEKRVELSFLGFQQIRIDLNKNQITFLLDPQLIQYIEPD